MDKEKVMNLIVKAHTQLNQVEVKGIQAAEGILITAKLLEAAAEELNKAEELDKEASEEEPYDVSS
jgi:hypothetical protein